MDLFFDVIEVLHATCWVSGFLVPVLHDLRGELVADTSEAVDQFDAMGLKAHLAAEV